LRFLDDLIDPEKQLNKPNSWLKIVLEARLYYKSLKPLIEFPAFLVQNVCPKNKKLIN